MYCVLRTTSDLWELQTCFVSDQELILCIIAVQECLAQQFYSLTREILRWLVTPLSIAVLGFLSSPYIFNSQFLMPDDFHRIKPLTWY